MNTRKILIHQFFSAILLQKLFFTKISLQIFTKEAIYKTLPTKGTTMTRIGCFFLSLLVFCQVQCLANEAACFKKFQGHRVLIGPEAYHVYRHRDGGTKQHGWLGGGRFLYDYMRRYSLYWAIEAAIAAGELSGHSSSGNHLKSNMRDRSIEARLGYTFQVKRGHKFAFTPFIGAGYLIEDNDFKNPTLLHLRFKISYRYLTAGFISSIYLCQGWKAGCNLKVRYLLDPRCKITHDPEYRSTSLKIGNDDLQYRIELPVTYEYGCVALVATPFYENRLYGGWVGYPFDFMKTCLYNYGATFQLQWIF